MRKFALLCPIDFLMMCRKSTCISLLVAAALLFPKAVPSQQISDKNSFGVAWRVIGPWRIAGNDKAISEGSAVQPGALLQPLGEAKSHSVTILLPDGQRVLYECFTSRDCDRGFRVPSLYKKPSTIGTDLLARVNAVLMKKDSDISSEQSDYTVARDEAAAVVDGEGKVEVAGLAAALSDGSYSYVVRQMPHGSQQQSPRLFDKHGRSVTLLVGAEGLFEVSIYDRLNTPRISLLIAAVKGPRGAETVKSFEDVAAQMKDWNEDYQGWPTHEFRRAYLRSVTLGIEPGENPPQAARSGNSEAADVTCEPKFEPAPGVFKADTEVKLQCSTPGAVIRYTVDGSQPLEDAAIYQAPVVVKGTALMIKAFASAPGKKDSPVVTGIFRIGE